MAVVCGREVGGGQLRRVHFIYLGGEFLWQHWRAIETAKVHEADETIVHCAAPLPTVEPFSYDVRVVLNTTLPLWLRDHPIGLANVKDLYLWHLMENDGGLYLDLDTISLAPCWDLLTRDLVVSQEYESLDGGEHPYNSAVVLGRQGSRAAKVLRARALDILKSGRDRWGAIGPHLLTDVVRELPHAFDVAPYGVLNGWRDGTVIRYYNGERPGPEVRVAHLFSSSRMHLFREDMWMPVLEAAA